MSGTFLRAGAFFIGSAGLGVALGATYSDKIQFYMTKVERSVKGEPASVQSPEQLLAKAVDITRGSGEFAILSTVNDKGGVSSRMIQPFEVEFKGGDPKEPRIFFNTNLLSRKVQQLENNPNVALSYLNSRDMSCVTWQGTCTQVLPPQEANKYWREWLRIFYPEGPNGGRFSTWVITPESIQVLSVTENLVSARKDWIPPEINRNPTNGLWERTDHHT